MKSTSHKKKSIIMGPTKIVHIPEDVHTRLKVEAAKRKMSLSAYVLELIDKGKAA